MHGAAGDPFVLGFKTTLGHYDKKITFFVMD